ncbi:hypothetical protein BDN70DRAFT_1648 [Pholiota conissans]|uniref:F-box domain-containing protein n=1 Tax=Pholiota conissans TaxID=109636 RepID=A0A9P5ZDZ9_9AGAR|nr:hypothetical protein BDN70DRAFT_1648 [Pholiota conissans]
MDSNNNGSDNPHDHPTAAAFAQAVNQLNLPPIVQTSYPPLVPSTLPSAASPFVQAVNQSNLPTVAQISYPHFVPSTFPPPASSIAPHGGNHPTTGQQQPPTATTSTPPGVLPSQSMPITTPSAMPNPTQPPSAVDYYRNIATQLQAMVLLEWSPRSMTPEEILEYRLATQRRIERIQVLESQQARVGVNADALIEQALFVARVDYRLRFFRTFRINDLPSEIFTNILRLFCWSAPNPAENIKARKTVTWTCRHWRAMALADHTLWNAIAFTDFPKFERSAAWLERSGNAVVDIRISDTSAKPWTLDVARVVIQIIFTKLSNLRILVIMLQDWDPILYIIDAFRVVKEQNIPMVLERFEVHRMGATYIQIGRGYEPEYYSRFIPLFGGAEVRTLNHVTMNAIHIDWAGSYIKNLTTLDMRRVPLERVPSLQDFRKLLEDSPTMNKLVLDGAGPSPRVVGAEDLPAIELPMLRSLALGDFNSQYATYAASQFTCINVLDLTLMNVIRDDFSPFWTLLTGRLPALRALTLYGADLFNNSVATRLVFLRFLKSIPKLAFLRISTVTTHMLELFLFDTERLQPVALTAQGADPTAHPACPELRILEYHTVDPNYIARWVATRTRMGLPIRKIYVEHSKYKEMTAAHKQRMVAAMGGMGTIQSLFGTGRPVEELELLI